MVELRGFLGTNAGAAINAANVAIFPVSLNATPCTAVGCATATTTTNTSGEWCASALAENTYDIRITCGSSVRWRHYCDEIQARLIQIGDSGATCAGNLYFGSGNDSGIRWSTGDASNHAVVIAIGDTSQQLHITDLGAIGTDWARCAGTHPELAIHSNTTPITDYLAIGNHDGTTAYIDVVGGTTLALRIAGTVEANLLACRFDPNANDGASLGSATVSWADLFLAAGGVINWANGEITITETDANTLTIAGVATRVDLAAGILEMNNAVEWDTGVAVVAAEYSVGRDADGTNQLHFNVPTGATFEFSVNDVAQAVLGASTLTGNVVGTGASQVAQGSHTAPASSDTAAGHVELATIAETNTGTSTVLAVTPDGISGALRTVVLTAAGGTARTTAGSAVPVQVETATNRINYWTMDFDQTTEENAQWQFVMPDSYDGGTVTARVLWTAASSTGGVTWGVRGTSYADDDAIEVALGTEVEVDDTLIAAADVHISAATAAITLAGGPVGGEYVVIQVARKVGNANDTLAADARLLAVRLEYTINAYSD